MDNLNIQGKIQQLNTFNLNEEGGPKLAHFFLGVFLASVLLMLALLGFYFALNNTAAKTKAKLTDAQQQMTALKQNEEKINEATTLISALKVIHSQKSNPTYIFQELARILPKNVVLVNLAIDESNKMKIDAKTTSLTAVAKTLAAFSHDKDKPTEENPVFKNVNLTGISFDKAGIGFSLEMEVKPPKTTTKETK